MIYTKNKIKCFIVLLFENYIVEISGLLYFLFLFFYMSEKIFPRAAFERAPLCGSMAASSVLCLWPCPGGIYTCRPCLCGAAAQSQGTRVCALLALFHMLRGLRQVTFSDFKSHLCKMGRKRGSSFLRRILCQRAVSNF